MKTIYAYQEKLMEKEKLLAELKQLVPNNKLLEMKNQYREKKRLFMEIVQKIKAMNVEQKQMAMTVKDEEALAHSMEEALYGGNVNDPKELKFIQSKLDQLEASIKKNRGEQKKIREALQSEIAYYRYTEEEMEKLQESFAQKQNALKAKHQDIDARIATIDEELKIIAQKIKPEELNDFLEKRPRFRGRPYAQVIHGNTCGGCHQKMPQPLLDRLKSGKNAVCDHCDRILFYEEEISAAKDKTCQKT